jgi:type I restriction enzyme M protein
MRAKEPNGTYSQLVIRREKSKIWSHVRQKWLEETPEELVRQEYLCLLVNHYAYTIDQIDEEVSLPGERGNKHARADFVIWRTAEERTKGKTALIVVECKADNVAIDQRTYEQGANYANNERAKFFVAHNRRSTKFFKVDLAQRAPNYSAVKDIPLASASDDEIKKLLTDLKPFEGREFADLLHQCHNIIRNNEHLDPAAAFDEIAKLLFVKVWVERRLTEKRERKNLFTVEFLQSQLGKSPINTLFEETKEAYRADKIFERDERINLRPATVEGIVKKLEGYNLSQTSEDVKGIAFERFLGGTFRGEIGQFFTPRPVVEFMVRMLDPKEGEYICDPASGSGGFLIRCFEVIREKIYSDVDARYRAFCTEVDAKSSLKPAERARRKRQKFEELQEELDPYSDPDAFVLDKTKSRIWKLSNLCIFGTDANDRMARTSKMNMIMHGDGHGGVHHHNGLLNVNGIFEGRFDAILTNPPFGATVTADNKILPGDYKATDEARKRYIAQYGSAYEAAIARVEAAEGKPLLSLFKLPRSTSIKTELVFIERCLDLLKPGGRLAVVLPEGIFNNPSLGYAREFTEDRAYLRAVVSLPAETFLSSGASVKCSILFLEKFKDADKQRYDYTRETAIAEVTARHEPARKKEAARIENELAAAKASGDRTRVAELRKELAAYESALAERIATEGRALLKQRFDYPVFLYEAERVGITATGDEDLNELYPGPQLPPGVAKSCLELYREFREEPASLDPTVTGSRESGFAVNWAQATRWSPGSFRKVTWNWPPSIIRPLSVALKRRLEPVDRDMHPLDTLTFGSLHFGGELSRRDMTQKREVKGRLFFAHADDVVYSKIDARHGAIGIVPKEMSRVVFSSEYPIYEVNPSVALPEYVKFLFRARNFREQINSLISGASGRKRVEPTALENIEVPMPSIETQRAILAHWLKAEVELVRASQVAAQAARDVEEMILGTRPAPTT